MEVTGVPNGDPAVTAARSYLCLRSHDASLDMSICTYFTHTTPHSVNSRQITALLRLHATKIGYQTLGFYPHKIGTHSLYPGGDTDLHLTNVPDSTIKL